MRVELRKLSDAKPYPGNPRHNGAGADAVVASIKQFGFRRSIVVDVDSIIICGPTDRTPDWQSNKKALCRRGRCPQRAIRNTLRADGAESARGACVGDIHERLYSRAAGVPQGTGVRLSPVHRRRQRRCHRLQPRPQTPQHVRTDMTSPRVVGTSRPVPPQVSGPAVRSFYTYNAVKRK
jgi:hypothetical protein